MCTGKRKTTQQEDNDRSNTPKITVIQGYMILFKEEYGDIGVGEVKEHIGSCKLRVALYNGQISGPWSISENTHTHLVDKDWILDGMIFQLTSGNCLPSRVKKTIRRIEKELY